MIATAAAVVVAAAAVVTLVDAAGLNAPESFQIGTALHKPGESGFITTSEWVRSNELLDISPWQFANYSNESLTVLSVAPAGMSKGLVLHDTFMVNMCLTIPPYYVVEDWPHFRRDVFIKTYPATTEVVTPFAQLPKETVKPPPSSPCYKLGHTWTPMYLYFVSVKARKVGVDSLQGFDVTYRSAGVTYKEFIPERFIWSVRPPLSAKRSPVDKT
jgi:hypothetical protein